MGRLQVVILLLAVACDDPKKASGGGRSEQVVTTAAAATTSNAAPTAEHSATAPHSGALCDHSPRSLPKSAAAFVDATGAVSDRGVPWNGKHAQWVSFFASWCGPCKEEIPRLQRFVSKLAGDGIPVDLTYVSIDDDLRQLTAFLTQQPEGGLKSSYWLKDGPPRTAWLAPLKMSTDAPLPEHGLFDAKGKLRCWVSGAIDENDYAQIASTLR